MPFGSMGWLAFTTSFLITFSFFLAPWRLGVRSAFLVSSIHPRPVCRTSLLRTSAYDAP